MTSRQFDPVFSASLRNELEALAERPDALESVGRRPIAARPQVWAVVVTALVLVAATVGLLRITHAAPRPAEPTHPTVMDPLSRITDATSPYYVARAVRTIVDTRGVGPGARDVQVPPGVTDVRVYLNCSGSAKYSVGIDGSGAMSGSACNRDSGTNASMGVRPGKHTVTVGVSKGVAWALTVIETPPPTVSSGALIDPLAAVRDRRNPDALVGNAEPVLVATGLTGGSTASTPNHPAARLRAYFVCRTASASATAVVDGHVMRGCMNSIAHWFDFTPSAGPLTARFETTGDAAFLVVRAPQGVTDSPASVELSYPKAQGTLLARAAGSGAVASGTYRPHGTALTITTTCRGTGWLEIMTDQGGTTTRGEPCSATAPNVTGFEGPRDSGTRPTWSVVPHGDISWTFQLSAAG